jgi:hypothetical protein
VVVRELNPSLSRERANRRVGQPVHAPILPRFRDEDKREKTIRRHPALVMFRAELAFPGSIIDGGVQPAAGGPKEARDFDHTGT